MDFRPDPLRQATDAPRQRARGEIRAAFARAGARSEASRLFETGGLRLRFPRAGSECEAVIVNIGGGIAGGDLLRFELAVASGAEVFATTQAAEKVYRADGEPAQVAVKLIVEPGASLVWAPQETLLFEGSNFVRRLEADVAPDGALLIVEATVFGRLAHGETRIDAAFRDDWRIWRGGKLLFAEAVRLENAGAALDRPAVGRGARSIATLLCMDPAAPSRLDDLRATLNAATQMSGETLEAGAGLVEGALVARLLSPSPVRLRAGLVAAMRTLRRREAPRLWS